MKPFFQSIKNGLVVSCQALANEPLHSSYIMGRMALAAKQGGAVGIRANSKSDITEIKSVVDLPVIGIVKRDYPDSPVFITATLKEIDELIEAKAEIIALDATNRKRPNNEDLKSFIKAVKAKYPGQILMADTSSPEEAVTAAELGFDCVSTTLIGYTDGTADQKLYHNDFSILKEIIADVDVPVIAEGNILTPDMAERCIELGAHAVVVGGAITRPQLITQRFTDQLALQR